MPANAGIHAFGVSVDEKRRTEGLQKGGARLNQGLDPK
jgi:hypothetical protein